MIFTKHVIKFFASIVMIVGISSTVLLGNDVVSFPARWNRVNVNLATLLTNASQPKFDESKQILDEAIKFVSTNIAKERSFVGAVMMRGFSWNDVMSSLREAFAKLSAICSPANVAVLAETEQSLKTLETSLGASGNITVVKYMDPTTEASLMRKPRNQEDAMARLAQLNPELQELLPFLRAAQLDASIAAQKRDMLATTIAADLEGQLRLYAAVCEARRVLGGTNALTR